MSVGEAQGGLPPDSVVEDEADILRDSRRLIETWHDNRRYSMTRVTLAPCSPFSVSPALMRESAALARSYPGVRLHTHLAECKPDVDYSLATFGLTPGDYAESLGWLGADVWHAHGVWLDDRAIERFAGTGTGVAHCPCSNMRLGRRSRAQAAPRGVPVGLGTDGAASNDATNLLREARQARCRHGSGNSMRRQCRRAKRLRWRPSPEPVFWAGMTSAAWRRGWRRISSASTWSERHWPVLCTIPLPRWCSAMWAASTTATSMDAAWWRREG